VAEKNCFVGAGATKQFCRKICNFRYLEITAANKNIGQWRSGHQKKSPHFWTVASDAPHGMIGTVEVEFFGEPSISLSEYTM